MLAALAWLACSCSSPSSSQATDDVFTFGKDVPAILGDTAKGDGVKSDAPDDSGADPADGTTDAAVEGGPETSDAAIDAGETSLGSCEFPASPTKGEPGASCAAASDCDSGLCVDGPNGKICTVNCTDCCPGGFKCATYKGGVDPVLACLPAWTQLCRPCDLDAECAADPGALCVAYGGAGSFCAAQCDSSADCPTGFACQAAQGSAGAGKQCMKQVGECACSAAATAAGAKTTCSVANGAGTCTGIRKCTLTGLEPCMAATPAVETCDGQDNDCNGLTDEPGAQGCTVEYPDGDGDGYGKAGAAGKCICAAVGTYSAVTSSDCDDSAAGVHPGAAEVCDNIDNNCDGQTDEGCDDDGDGYCDANSVVVGTPIVCPKGTDDCDDTNAGVHPGTKELCGNGLDDNCDGITDSGVDPSGCMVFYVDGDSDGFGSGTPVCACAATGLYTSSKPGDCNDADPNVNPGKTELCGNGVDDNCNSQTDEAGAAGCASYFTDEDEDGYGVGTGVCLCGPDATHTATKGGDCNDQASTRHPGASEVCNGIDDDCDGLIDPAGSVGCAMVFPDADGDGYGVTLAGSCVCGVPSTGFALQGGDCNDQSAAMHPTAVEVCDGLDNNCNGQVDENGAQGCVQYFLDSDGDGYGDGSQSQCTCAATGAFTAIKPGDCNDQVFGINPGATELCDGVDNNCNGQVDEAGALDCTVYGADSDGDGYGLASDTQCLCAPTGVYTSEKLTDCNDQSKAIHPGVDETCDGLDNNCDGVTDPNGSEGCKYVYLDQDGDGYGTANAVPICACGGVAGYASTGGDCNDGNPAVHPGAIETCNGIDDDCDGSIDGTGSANCTVYFQDSDQDGYGIGSGFCMCAPISTLSALIGGDCNDSNAALHPNATELCNGLDDNCNGQTDEGVLVAYYIDADQDGYGTGNATNACGPSGSLSATVPGDCNDSNSAIHPNATEVCNGADDNCNGQTDEGLTVTYYADADKDGYGTSASVSACGPSGNYTASLTGDCNDGSAAIHPGASEVCNGLDDNCNGQTDEGLATQTYYLDADKDGYGVATSQIACAPSGNYTASNATDCNDGDAAINPGHAEVCGNSKDDNCDGQTDEKCGICLNTSWDMTPAQSAGATGWKRYNAAVFDPTSSDGIDVVPNLTNKRGQVYYTTGRIAAAKTHIEFDWAVETSGEADGIALNFIDVANLTALETYIAATAAGQCIGYGVAGVCGSGSVSGLHLKLDTHYNSNGDKLDGSNNSKPGYEFALTLNGDPENYVPNAWFDAWLGINSSSSSSGDIEDWGYHHYIIDINGTTFTSTIDGQTALKATLPATFKGGFIGFSAGTGSSATTHEVGNFKITQTGCP